MKAVRFHIGEIYDAVIEISETSKDPKYRSEAAALAKEIKSFKFLVSLCIWYEVLCQFNFANEVFQHTPLEQIKHTSSFLTKYRECGFEQAKVNAKVLAKSELEMDETMLTFPNVTSQQRKKAIFV